MKRIMQVSKVPRFFGHGLWIMLFTAVLGGHLILAESQWVPLDPDITGKLLAHIVKTQLVGTELGKDGLGLKITALNDFSMDWQRSRFNLDCGFRLSYNNGFFDLEESGTIALSGAGLMSVPEQKLGVKLLKIDGFQLAGFDRRVNAGLQLLLEKGLAEKEFWMEEAPAESEILIKDNLGNLLGVALNQILPQRMDAEGTEVILNRVSQIAFGEEPGNMQARIALEGTYRKWLKLSFAGEAGVNLRVFVDPEALAGKIIIEELTDLQLDRSPAMLDGMLRKLINDRLQGKSVEFSWE